MTKLREALLVSDKTRYFRKNVSSSSPFKRSVPLMKVAKAWDLYLALENAYTQWTRPRIMMGYKLPSALRWEALKADT